ncbi:MAG: hypothetical protein OK457_06970 [Thaumarchaeota archaeon]|nr:hypothetical protein [Nitrososphaerota archaeon]
MVDIQSVKLLLKSIVPFVKTKGEIPRYINLVMRKFDSVGGVVIMLKPLGTPPKLVNFNGLAEQLDDDCDWPFAGARKTGEAGIATNASRASSIIVETNLVKGSILTEGLSLSL